MKIILKILFAFFILVATAQNVWAKTSETDFIDLMRSGGKIYVVYLLLGVIVTGILIYLVMLERKVARLEKQIPGKSSI